MIPFLLLASFIAPPTLLAPCLTGFELSADCVPGTIVRISDGIARTEMLRPTPLVAEPAPLPPAILPPVWIETPVESEVPVTSAAPEPRYQDGLVAIVGLGIFWGLIRGETRMRGGK